MSPKTKKTKQRQPLQRRGQETRSAILKAAAQVLEKDGILGFNTNIVAERAGVSIGSLYQYFKDKESLLSELVESSMYGMNEKIQQLMISGAGKKPPRDVIHGLVSTIIEELNADRMLAAVVFEYTHLLADQKRMLHVDDFMIPMLSTYLKAHLPKLRKKDVEFASYVAMQAFRGVIAVSIARDLSKFDRKKLSDESTDLLWRYLSD